MKPSLLTFIKSNDIYYILFLLLLLPPILSGCKKRQIVRPTPQMDISAEFWIRVLLNENIKSCKLESQSKFTIINSADGEELTSFNPSEMPLDVNICDEVKK